MPALLVAIPFLSVVLLVVALGLANSTHAWALPTFSNSGGLTKILTAPLNAILGAGNSIISAMIDALNALIDNYAQPVVDLLNGIPWAWNNFLSENEQFTESVWNTLDHAFSVAIPDAFSAAKGYIDSQVQYLNDQLASLIATVEDRISAVVQSIPAYVERGVSEAEGYADKVANDAYANAIAYVDSTEAELRTALSSTIATAASLADTAEKDAQAALSQAGEAIADIAPPVGKTLSDFENYVNGLGLAGIITAVPALSLLLTQVLTETGLQNEDCRSKVKGICGTNPQAWGDLIAGIAAAGILLDFKMIVRAAGELSTAAVPLIKSAM